MTTPDAAPAEPNELAAAVASSEDGNTTVEDQTDTADGPDDSNREAAKYRHRAKTAEGERDQLAERLTALQRAEAERLAADKLGDGTDLWSAGTELADLLDDDGNLDTAKVDEQVNNVLVSKPHWRKRHPASPPASTVTANGLIGHDGGPTFVDAFKPRNE